MIMLQLSSKTSLTLSLEITKLSLSLRF